MLLIEVATQAYRKAGLLKHAGQGINGSQQQEFLHVLDSLIDADKIDRNLFYQVLRTVFQTNPNKPNPEVYSVGDAVDNADWVIERPEKLLGAGYLIDNGPGQQPSELPMDVLMDFQQFQTITNKGVTSSLAWVMYYRASLPTGTAQLWPVPSAVFGVTLYTPGYVEEFDDIMATVMVPKGWREYFEYAGAVAVRDCNPLTARLLPQVEAKADLLRSRIKAQQFTPQFIQSDPGARVNPVTPGRWWGAREWPGGYE